MDFTNLSSFFVTTVVVACLIIGYVLKNSALLRWIPNDDIPTILAIVGAVLNVLASGLSLDSIVYGALMGLASTGLHQSFKAWIENRKTGE